MREDRRLSPGRLTAGRALLQLERGGHLDRALEQHGPDNARELGLAWSIAFGVTRHRGELDAVIEKLAKRPITEVDRKARVALRIGLYERRYSRVPDHAAVDQGVRLAVALGAGRARGFVNAVLRRGDVAMELPATINHPDWLVQRWLDRWGPQATAAWCTRQDSAAPLSLALRDRSADALAAMKAALDDEGIAHAPAQLAGAEVPSVLVLPDPGRPVESLPGFDEGLWWVMDPAAAASADLLAAADGERVLDACAAPGGKSLRLASSGASVLAVDRAGRRLELLEENVRRVGLPIRSLCQDLLEAEEEGDFDAALLDAPCTALGTLRRHPEIRWQRQPTDPAAMALQQGPMLEAVARRVRSGGRLVYSVCSPEPEEGAGLVGDFVASQPGWTIEVELATAPHGEHDGFYAARLTRGDW